MIIDYRLTRFDILMAVVENGLMCCLSCAELRSYEIRRTQTCLETRASHVDQASKNALSSSSFINFTSQQGQLHCCTAGMGTSPLSLPTPYTDVV